MSLALITPPADEPVSLAEMKAHLRVEHGDEDVFIEACARAARRAVELRGEIALVEQQWRLALDRPPSKIVALPRAPVVSVDAVTVLAADLSPLTVDPALYEAAGGESGRLVMRGAWPQPGRALDGVRIDFTAGWAAPAEVPEDLRFAVKLLAAHFYENRESVSAERVFSVPQAADSLIARYRRIRL